MLTPKLLQELKQDYFAIFFVAKWMLSYKLFTVNTYILVPNKAMFVLFAGSVRLNFLPINCFIKTTTAAHQKRGTGRNNEQEKIKK